VVGLAGPGASEFRPAGIGVDDSGGLYLSGNVRASQGKPSAVTVRYDKSGREVWRRVVETALVHEFDVESTPEGPVVKAYGMAGGHLMGITYDRHGGTVWGQKFRIPLALGGKVGTITRSGNYLGLSTIDPDGKTSGIALVKLGPSRWAGQRWD
jgi:hypothetical protein